MTNDIAEVRRAVAAIIEPGQVTELRALEVTTPSYRKPHTVAGYFDDMDKLAEAAASITGALGIYIVLNPINPALLGRAYNRLKNDLKPATADEHIIRRRWLPVDCDPIRPAGISASNAEHNAAIDKAIEIREHLLAEGWPLPILADSGNGGHLLYSIDLPANDGGTVERWLKTLAERFSDSAVNVDTGNFNPARIWKLYGTVAAKGDSIPDRPHRLAKIIHLPTGEEGEDFEPCI